MAHDTTLKDRRIWFKAQALSISYERFGYEKTFDQMDSEMFER